MQTVDQAIGAARSSQPILVTGPSGSGREHIARAIHAWSNRASAPFAVVSAPAGTPAAQQERELFGALSSSEDGQGNALVRAGDGTLLINEFQTLADPVRLQLIQTIKDGCFRRAGDSETTQARCRLIATSDGSDQNVLGDLDSLLVSVAPLAERSEDILPLAAHFLAVSAEEQGVRPVGYTADARRWLIDEPWTGNVRELRERVRQAVRLAGGGAISAEALILATEGEEVPSFKEAKRAFETRYVEGLLRRCSGNISRAARLAKKDRKDFDDVIRRTGIDPKEFRP